MMDKMMKFFETYSKGKKRPKVEAYIDQKNIRIVTGLALLSNLWMLYFLLKSFSKSGYAEAGSWIAMNRGFCVLFLVAGLMMLITSAAYLTGKWKNHKKINAVLYFYIVAGGTFATYISTEYYAKQNMVVSTYLIVNAAIFCLLVIKPLPTVILTMASFSGYYFAMQNSANGFPKERMVTFFGEWLILTLIGITHYIEKDYEATTEDELEKSNAKLRQQSYMDELTGLKNRHALRKDYENYIGGNLLVSMVDIDDFKFYNDTYGHDAGDEILEQMAKILRDNFGTDSCYRYGGDEFLIITNQWDEEKVLPVFEKIKEQLQDISAADMKMGIAGSIGYIYGNAAKLMDIREMIRQADVNLYEAKNRGKNCIVGNIYEANNPLESLEEKMHFRKDRDDLTGLPNIMYFRNRARRMISNIPKDQKMAIVYFNIENFKIYNETYGFQEGDELLKTLAENLMKIFPDDLISRFGDDHFVVLAEKNNLTDKLNDAENGMKQKSNVTVKAGIFFYEDRTLDISRACDRAKLACDTIKKKTNILWCVYNDKIGEQSRFQQYILEHFDEALRKEWICVYYQEIFRIITRKGCNVEALSRWIDPEKGMIMPGSYIGILEDYNLIHRLDLYIIEHVCRDLKQLVDEGQKIAPTSINISRLDFENCDIFKEVVTIADRYGVAHSNLNIELTESAFVQNRAFLKNEITKFHKAGFKVWMDDFGSGYSSLNILEEYDFDLLKIDMHFLQHFSTNEKTHSIISHVVSMAKELEIQTLAEGVESEAQLSYLNSIGCEMAQGFLLGKPQRKEDIQECVVKDPDRIEDESQRKYYEMIGRINLLKPISHNYGNEAVNYIQGIPICILEYDGRSIHHVCVNDNYKLYLKSIGHYTLEDAETILNDPTLYFHTLSEELRIRCMKSNGWESMDYIAQGNYCTASARLIIADKTIGKSAFLVMQMNLSTTTQVERSREMQAAQHFLFALYRRVDLFKTDGTECENLFCNEKSLAENMVIKNGEKTAEAYASLMIAPKDQKRFMEFYELSSMEQRMHESGTGHLLSFFRTKKEDGSYDWERYILVPIMMDRQKKVISCIRKIDENVRESIEKQFQ